MNTKNTNRVLGYAHELIKAGDTLLIQGLSFKVWSVEGRFARLYWTDKGSNVTHARRVEIAKILDLVHARKK
jgi:hypothetical protein